MAGAGTPGPSTPMLHVENEGGVNYLQRGERKRRGEGGGVGRRGEAWIIDVIFFFTTNSEGGWAERINVQGEDTMESGQWVKSGETRKTTSRRTISSYHHQHRLLCCPFPHVTNLNHAICYASREKCGHRWGCDGGMRYSYFRLQRCNSTILHSVLAQSHIFWWILNRLSLNILSQRL